MTKSKKDTAGQDRVLDQDATIAEDQVNDATNEESPIETLQLEDVAAERLPGVFEATDDEEEEPEEEERTFRTISRSLEDLPIDSIQHFKLIKDFASPTTATHPIIVRTDEGNFCIEGWSLVLAAQSEGKTSILCEVDELDDHSDEEISLRKGGIRSLTRGGEYTYAEMMRNARDLLAMLLLADEDLKIYGQGQRRYGEGFVNNRKEDVRHILAMRLGKNRDTINKYLSHCEYLSDEAIKTFIDRKAPKDFFEKTKGKKQMELNKQKGINLSIGRKTMAISKFMIEEFEKFPKGKGSGQPQVQGPVENNADDQPESTQSEMPVGDSNEDNEGRDVYSS